MNTQRLIADFQRRFPVEAGELARRMLQARIARERIPERATAVDPEPKPPEANCMADDGAGSSSEAAPAELRSGSQTTRPRPPGDTGKAGRADEAGGSPAPDSDTGGARPSGNGRALSQRAVEPHDAGASPVADEGVDTSPEGLLHFLGASDDWRENRRRLRQAGYEVKQYDGIVYLDGRPSADPALYP